MVYPKMNPFRPLIRSLRLIGWSEEDLRSALWEALSDLEETADYDLEL
jgi:hypothetical protein